MDKELEDIMSGLPITAKEFFDSFSYEIDMHKDAFIDNLNNPPKTMWNYDDWRGCFIAWMEWTEDYE